MSYGDALVIALTAYCFSYWVKWNVKTMRGAYYAGVGLGAVFWIGAVEYCAR